MRQMITQLCNCEGVEIIERHLIPNHVYMLRIIWFK